MRASVNGLTTGFDALTRLTGRLSDRVEAHLSARTRLLRAHYENEANRLAKPLPGIDGPIDLALRGGVKKAA